MVCGDGERLKCLGIKHLGKVWNFSKMFRTELVCGDTTMLSLGINFLCITNYNSLNLNMHMSFFQHIMKRIDNQNIKIRCQRESLPKQTMKKNMRRKLLTTRKGEVEKNRVLIIPTCSEPKPKKDSMSIMNVQSTLS